MPWETREFTPQGRLISREELLARRQAQGDVRLDFRKPIDEVALGDHESLWAQMVPLLQAQVTDFIWHCWFRELAPCRLAGDELSIAAPGHTRGWVRERYGELLRVKAAEVARRPIKVQLVGEAA